MTRSGSDPVEAAAHRFPDQARRIRRLVEQSEAFRDMCEELMAAEDALSRIEAEPTAHGAARKVECEGWITRLADEMAEALRQPEVIPLPISRRPR